MLDEILEAKNEDTSVTLYDRALSHVVAMKMAQRGDVVEFRNAHLNGSKIPWRDIGDWIWRQAPVLGVSTTSWFVSLPVPEDVVQRIHRATMTRSDDESAPVTISVALHDLINRDLRQLTLPFLIPGEEMPRRTTFQSGTVLEKLYWLAGRLSAIATWTEAQAVVFILTDQTPLIRQFTFDVAENVELPALTRVTLHLDPRISQRELTSHFQSVRQDLVHRRHRDISTKHLTLALFSTTTDGRTGSLRDRMDRWNTQHPDWPYQHTTNFSRDTGVAIRRLLESNYESSPAHVAHTGDSETEEE